MKINFSKKQATLFLSLFLMFIAILSFIYAEKKRDKNKGNEVTEISLPTLMQEAEKISHQGLLKSSKNKDYIYLSISDDYINNLYPILLNNLSENEKKCMKKFYSYLGSHITLLEKNEDKSIEITKNNFFNFTLVRLKKINFSKKLKNDDHISINVTWYVIEVSSPNLDKNFSTYRQKKYGNPIPLHISLARSEKILGTDECYKEAY